ncbi:hypothetical protein HJFPF1_10517 [Paramyrothecium foliicola]|nr:hypothetical protein HJFPF1_10517 [Paramyrothecium foliicola]
MTDRFRDAFTPENIELVHDLASMARTAAPRSSLGAATELAMIESPRRDNKLRQEFDRKWETYLAAIQKPTRRSGPSAFLTIPEWEMIKSQGQGILPFLIELLPTSRNIPLVVICIRDLRSSLCVGAPTCPEKVFSIMSRTADSIKRISTKIWTASLQLGTLRGAGVEETRLVDELLQHAAFQDIVTEGIDAVPHIVDALVKGPKFASGAYMEMLKQIHSKMDVAESRQSSFEVWLEDYFEPLADAEAQEKETKM